MEFSRSLSPGCFSFGFLLFAMGHSFELEDKASNGVKFRRVKLKQRGSRNQRRFAGSGRIDRPTEGA
jgi:hypothetical protein